MTMDRRTAVQPMVGQHIYTTDGEHLGQVKEVRGAYFKVDAPMRPDYWLRTDEITFSAGDNFTVGFEKHQLGEYKVSKPDEAAMAREPHDTMTARASTKARDAAMAREMDEGERMGTYTPTTVPAGLTGFTAGMWDEARPTYRQDWEQRYGTSGRRWEDVEPGYRYGFEMARDARYAGRPWPEAEPDLASNYAMWTVQCGYPEDRTWEEMRGSARESWDRIRGDNG